jgi:ATP-dependent DNA helicase DinG
LPADCALQVPSPFDYARQAALYIPVDAPAPDQAQHSGYVAQLAAQGAVALGGRTMVLTTTVRAMRSIAAALGGVLEGSGLEVLVQGQAPKRALLETFQSGQGGSVLVATASFWEGVDIQGSALQLVVIDKLPFTPPDDLVLQAQAQACLDAGGKPFKDIYLPQAALALKQGAGRLIRSESDQGILLVCDPRLVHKGYGKRMLAALPSLRRLADEPQWLKALQELAQTQAAPEPGPQR